MTPVRGRIASEVGAMRGGGRVSARSFLLGAGLIWMVLAGGTELGSLNTSVRVVNSVIGAVVIAMWLWRLPRRADRTDLLVVAALLAFLAACAVSDYPRMSLEAATTALAFSAAFSLARWEVANPRMAWTWVTLVASCAVVLLLLFLSWWGSVWGSWIALTGAIPPLDIHLPVGPYRGHHVVGMLIALTLPAFVELTRRRLANVVGFVGIAISLVLIYMSGSRTVWLAVAVGLLVLVTAKVARVSRLVLAAAISALLTLAALAVTGALSGVLGRLVNTSTIGLRLEIWTNSLQGWLSDPFVGTGPGSFSAAFTFSDYFDVYERVGRHADNAIVQVLMEAGLLGLLAFGMLAAALIIGARQAGGRWTRPALGGIAIFAVMSLTDNPSDTANLVIVGLCWAALCTPAVGPRLAASWSPSWRTAAIGAAAVAVATATSSVLIASAAFDRSQSAAQRGDEAATLASLDVAVSFDPGHALYWRERGLHRTAGGDPAGASDLTRSLQLNPSDTIAMRAMSLVHARAGDEAQAIALARRAASLRPTHEENLTTLAYLALLTGDRELARDSLVDLLHRIPWIAASPDWSSHFPSDRQLEELLIAADGAWESGQEDAARFALSQVWLNAAIGEPADQLLERRGWARPYLTAVDRLARCDVEGAKVAILDRPPESPTEFDLMVMIMTGQLTDSSAVIREAIQLAGLRGSPVARLTTDPPPAASPLWEPDEDRRIYGRDVVVPVDLGLALPTEAQGLSAWLMDPSTAAQVGAPGSGLARCSQSR